MKIVPATPAARGAAIDVDELALLLRSAEDPSRSVRVAALDALTHLALGDSGWEAVGGLLRDELRVTTELEARADLLAIGSRLPLGFDVDGEVSRLEADTEARVRLVRAAERSAHLTGTRDEHDAGWARSPAPGFAVLSDAERADRRGEMDARVPGLASRLRIPGDREPRLLQDPDPVLVTLLVGWAARDPVYDTLLGNAIVAEVAAATHFLPDVLGLFDEYLAAVHDYLRGRPGSGPYGGQGSERWLPWLRDDEFDLSWRLWHVAWIVSRGGTRGLVSALAALLTGEDETGKLAALGLIADAADYVLEPAAPMFGGGARPLRPEPRRASEIAREIERSEAVRVRVDTVDEPPHQGQDEPVAPGADAEPGERPRPTHDLRFTVYRPGSVVPARWYDLLVFMHEVVPPAVELARELPAAERIDRQARTILGEEAPAYDRTAEDAAAAVPREGELTFVVELPGFRVNPPRQTVGWHEDIQHVRFRIRAGEHLPDRRARGRVTVFHGPIILAEMALVIRVGEESVPAAHESVSAYRKIFASYAREEREIVRLLETFFRAVGDRYFVDVEALRAGEEWNPGLARLIEEADVFQLFWSRRSMRSEWVRREWTHALGLGRRNFVRPVYWEDPIPEPEGTGMPPELERLEFRRLPVPIGGAAPEPATDERIGAGPGEGEAAGSPTFPPSRAEASEKAAGADIYITETSAAGPPRRWPLIALAVIVLLVVVVVVAVLARPG